MNAVVVGFGSIGPVHAHSIDKCENAEVYGICDIIKTRADEGAKKYSCKAFYDIDDCLRDENVDVIHICTPHYLHFEMITKALDSGKRVVCEKPVVMKKEELDMLYSKYDITKVFPIFQNRTNFCIEKLAEIIENDKEIGVLKGIKAIVTWSRGKDYYSRDNWHGRKQFEGGGVLINQAIHTLDLCILFGGKVKTVSSSLMNHSLKDVIDVEDTVSAFLNFENGAKGVFYATNSYSKDSDVELELHFENKTFLYKSGKLFVNDEFVCADSTEYIGKEYWGNGHVKTICDFYDNSSTLCIENVKNTMNVLFAIYESAK